MLRVAKQSQNGRRVSRIGLGTHLREPDQSDIIGELSNRESLRLFQIHDDEYRRERLNRGM